MSENQSFSIEEIKEMMETDSLELPITMALKKPVQYTEKEKVTSITFHRELEAGDVESMPASNQVMGDFFKPLAKMTAQTVPFVRKMKMVDLKDAIVVVSHFLGGSEEDET